MVKEQKIKNNAEAKRVVRNVASWLSADIVSKVISLFVTICVIRYLGSIRVGQYNYAITFAGMFGFIIDLGLNQLVIREVSRNRLAAAKYLGNFLRIQFFLSGIIFLAICVTITLIEPELYLRTAVYLAGLSVVMGSFCIPFMAMFNAFECIHLGNGLSLLIRVISAILTLGAILFGLGVFSFISIGIFLGLIMLFFSYYLCKLKLSTTPDFTVDPKLWKNLLCGAIPFAIGMAFSKIYVDIDVIMLKKISGVQAVGFYTAATKLVYMLIVIPDSISGALYPVLSRQYGLSEDRYQYIINKATKFSFMFGLPIAVGGTLLGKKLIFLLLKEEFAKSAIVFQIMIWIIPIICLVSILKYFIISVNKVAQNATINGTLALINILLNLYLIPKYDVVGAAISTIFSFLCCFLITLVYVGTKFGIGFPIKDILIISIPSLIMGTLVFIFAIWQVSILIIIPTAIMAYGLIVWFANLIDVEEKKVLLSFFLRK